MICAVDVYYRNSYAVAAGVLFHNWNDNIAANELSIFVPAYEEYTSGQFFRRELPCIMELLRHLDNLPEYIIIDGYVYLDNDQKPGLGKYLFDTLNGQSAIIGVAKSRYRHAPAEAEIYRCGSKRALYVTAVGVSAVNAKKFILQMYGNHRVPAMLQRADQLSRQKNIHI